MKKLYSLKVLDIFSKPIKKMDIDYEMLRSIVEVKLTLDSRRNHTMGNAKMKNSSFFVKTLLSYGIMGLFLVFFIFNDLDVFIQMTLCLGIVGFMTMLSLVADFSSVLLDVRDQNILLTRPIEPKTVNMAKIIHVAIYMITVVGILSLPLIIAGTFKYGILFSLVLIICLLINSVLIMVFTTLIYYVVIKFFDGEKLKDIINYFQILLTIIMIVGYQIIARVPQFTMEYDLKIEARWWFYLLPSSWYASLLKLTMSDGLTSHYLIMGVLGLVVPFVAVGLHMKLIMPSFESYLSKLSVTQNITKKKRNWKDFLSQLFSKLFIFNKTERICYEFGMDMLEQERKLKLKIIPQLVMSIILPFLFLFNIGFRVTSNSIYYLYVSIWLLSMLIVMVEGSENYKGAWIFKALPIEDPIYVVKGVYKAFLVKYILPTVLVQMVIFYILGGRFSIINYVIISINLFTILMIMGKSEDGVLPFSNDMESYKGDFMSVIKSMFFVGVLAAMHYGLNLLPFGGYVMLGLGLLFMLFVSKMFYSPSKKQEALQ